MAEHRVKGRPGPPAPVRRKPGRPPGPSVESLKANVASRVEIDSFDLFRLTKGPGSTTTGWLRPEYQPGGRSYEEVKDLVLEFMQDPEADPVERSLAAEVVLLHEPEGDSPLRREAFVVEAIEDPVEQARRRAVVAEWEAAHDG